MIKRMLFGGAIESVVLQRFEDCSLLRQVPDHQEVFADACSDQSIIVEILQREEDIPDDQICQYHFQELAVANESSESEVEDVRMLENISESAPFLQPFPVWILAGTQYVSKFKEEARNRVRLFLAVIRLEEHETDILVSVNVPIEIAPDSSSARQLDLDALQGDSNPDNAVHVFFLFLRNFKILDFGLFQGPEDAEEMEMDS